MSTMKRLPSSVLVATMGMELCCLYMGLTLAQQHLGAGYLSIALLMALYPLALLVRIMPRRQGGIRGAISLIGLILAILLFAAALGLAVWRAVTVVVSAGPILLAITFAALAWWLGSSLVHTRSSYAFVCFRVQMGVLFLLLFAGAGTLLPVILALLLAIVALSQARWETAASQSKGVLQVFPVWPVILGGLAVLIPAALIFLVISPDIAGAIINAVKTAMTAFYAWINVVMSSSFWQKQLVEMDLSCRCPVEPINETTTPKPTLPPSGEGMPEIVLWLIVGMFVLIIFLSVRKYRFNRKSHAPIKADFQLSSNKVSFFRQMLSLLIAFVRWLWRKLNSLFGGVRIGREPAHPPGALQSVRDIYRSLLEWAANRSMARLPSQTPTEYLNILSHKFAEQIQELTLITSIYVQARYSPISPGSGEFETVRDAWQRFRSSQEQPVTETRNKPGSSEQA
jgi:hypothetical protein